MAVISSIDKIKMERSRSENLEQESNPEQVINNAVATIENRDASDAILGSEWVQKAKNFSKTSVKLTGMGMGLVIGGALFATWRLAKGLFKFAKEAATGKMSFSKGYQIGQEIFENKKEKQ